MSVIMAIAAMQVAGGMDFLVKWAEHVLRKHPKHITFLAPAVGCFMTVCAGTGHTAFSILPVVAEVAKNKAFALLVRYLSYCCFTNCYYCLTNFCRSCLSCR